MWYNPVSSKKYYLNALKELSLFPIPSKRAEFGVSRYGKLK